MVGIRRFPCQPLRFYSFSTSSKPSPAELKYDPLVGYKNPDRPVATRRTDGSPSYGEPIRISRYHAVTYNSKVVFLSVNYLPFFEGPHWHRIPQVPLS